MLKMGFVILRLHLDIKFDQKIIQPCPADAEPTAGTTLFASESEHKIAITVLAERKSYIHKLHVAESPFMASSSAFHTASMPGDCSAYVFRIPPENQIKALSPEYMQTEPPIIFSLYFTMNIFACLPLISMLFIWRKKSLAGKYLRIREE